MSGIEELERWHRLWDEGIDPDHDCRANAEWAESYSWGTTVYGLCTVCGDEPEDLDEEEPPADPKPEINTKKLAAVVGIAVAYVVASVLLMTLTPLGWAAWLAVPPAVFLGGVVLFLVGILPYLIFDELRVWIRE